MDEFRNTRLKCLPNTKNLDAVPIHVRQYPVEFFVFPIASISHVHYPIVLVEQLRDVHHYRGHVF